MGGLFYGVAAGVALSAALAISKNRGLAQAEAEAE